MRLDRGGFSLHYEIAGAGPETVVLTHGLGSSGATWSALVAALAPRYRVVVWDLRSHGQSDSPDEACPLAVLGADLAAIVGTGGGGPVHVLGHSAGGVIAMRFAIDHPESLRSVTLVGTSSECNARAVAYYESLAETAERDGGAAAARRLGPRDETIPPPEGPGFARVARAMGLLHTAPITAELAGVRCPALVVVGEKDPLGVGGSVIISRRLPHARLEIVPERGHSIFREDAQGFARLVLGFLAERRATS
jgi:pimeloyl-ACP methyl ester carboxylesterase